MQSSTEYPCIASASNITTLLLIHLRISQQSTFWPCCGMDFKKEKKIPVKEMATFANLLEEQSWETVFNELFSLGVAALFENHE